MSVLMLILIWITVAAIGVIIAGLVYDNDDAKFSGTLGLVVIAVVGWLFLGATVEVDKSVELIKPDTLIIGQTHVYVEYRGESYKLSSIRALQGAKLGEPVYLEVRRNMYGVVVREWIHIGGNHETR